VRVAEGDKQALLRDGKGARVAQQVALIVEKMGKPLGLQTIANPRRRCGLPEDLPDAVGLEHGIGVTVAVAQKGVIFHIEEKYAALRGELPVDMAVHRVDGEQPCKKGITRLQAGYKGQRGGLPEVLNDMVAVERQGGDKDSHQKGKEGFPGPKTPLCPSDGRR